MRLLFRWGTVEDSLGRGWLYPLRGMCSVIFWGGNANVDYGAPCRALRVGQMVAPARLEYIASNLIKVRAYNLTVGDTVQRVHADNKSH